MGKTNFDFTGQVAIVTGANGGLGSEIARAFCRAGASMVLVGRDADKVRGALPDLADLDDVLITPGTDINDPDAAATLVQAALDRFGHLDILANTVGGYRAGTPVLETPVEDWDTMMTINARTAFIVSRAVAPVMVAQGHGKIIHTASRAAFAGTRHGAAYAASKAALLRLTESLSIEVRSHGINVNCVVPGIIDTPANREGMPNAAHSHWVTPFEIARIVLFLASEAAAPIHGAHIPAYGLS